MRVFSLLLVAFLLLAGCNPNNPGPDSTAVPSGSGALTPQNPQTKPPALVETDISDMPRAEYTATLPDTETAETTLPEMLRFNPDQIKQESLCPDNDFVPVQDLGMPSNLGLLLADANVTVSEAKVPYPIYFFYPEAQLPGKQLTLNQAEKMHSEPVSSPDGRLFYYLQYEKGQPARTLVVQSTDGQMKKIVLERAYPFGRPSWIDNRHIVWIDIPDPEIYWTYGGRPDEWEYIPTKLIDVQTLEIQELPLIHFLRKDGYYTVDEFIHGGDGNYVFLQHDTSDLVSLEIYSYETQTTRQVFTWLPMASFDHPRFTAIHTMFNSTINSIFRDGNVFRIMIQVSLEQLLSDPDTLAGHLYEFTFPEVITPSFIPYYFMSRNAFLFTRQTRVSEDFLEAIPQYLYRFDIDTQTVYDYCLDIQKWKGRADMSVSPGEEYVAITLYQDTMTGRGKKDTVLINLATGARALLMDYQMFDWVTIEQ